MGDLGIGIFLIIINILILALVLVLAYLRFQNIKLEQKWRKPLSTQALGVINMVMDKEEDGSFDLVFDNMNNYDINHDDDVDDDVHKSNIEMAERKRRSKAEQKHHKITDVLKQYLLNPNDIIMTKRVGAGAFGEVFKGTCMGEFVAIKTMLDVTEENVIDFKSEIILTAALRHPNIVNFVGACWSRKLMCLVLEWVAKGSLQDLLQTHDLRWEDPLLRLATDVARGMNYLHNRKYYDEREEDTVRCILHRDLKPDNALVSDFLTAKISDFGTSRAKGEEDVFMTAVGTPLYVAPEISRGELYDEKVDVYSFGLTLLKMCIEEPILEFIGKRWVIAFDKKKIPKQPMRLIRPMTEDGWRPITTENPIPFAPSSIHSLLIRCCSHQVSERPSFETILDELMTKCKEEIDNKVWFRDHVLQAPPPPHTPDSSNSNVISNVLHL